MTVFESEKRCEIKRSGWCVRETSEVKQRMMLFQSEKRCKIKGEMMVCLRVGEGSEGKRRGWCLRVRSDAR